MFEKARNNKINKWKTVRDKFRELIIEDVIKIQEVKRKRVKVNNEIQKSESKLSRN